VIEPRDLPEAVRLIKSLGREIDRFSPPLPRTTRRSYRTLLSALADLPHAELVQACVDAGADPNRRRVIGAPSPRTRADGDPPLLVAASEGRTEAVAILLEAGADPSLAGADGRTPLHEATSRGDSRAVALLVAAGADPKAEDELGRTPYVDSNGLPLAADIREILDHGRRQRTDSPVLSASARGPKKLSSLVNACRRRGVDLIVVGVRASLEDLSAMFGQVSGAQVVAEENVQDRTVAGGRRCLVGLQLKPSKWSLLYGYGAARHDDQVALGHAQRVSEHLGASAFRFIVDEVFVQLNSFNGTAKRKGWKADEELTAEVPVGRSKRLAPISEALRQKGVRIPLVEVDCAGAYCSVVVSGVKRADVARVDLYLEST
jgi:hypothetical protein